MYVLAVPVPVTPGAAFPRLGEAGAAVPGGEPERAVGTQETRSCPSGLVG